MNTFRTYAIVIVTTVGLAAPVPLLAAQTSTSPDLLTKKQVKELIANAKTPADHVRLQKHFLALAATYDAEADQHAAEADAYRRNGEVMHSKNALLAPGTVLHCERFAELDRKAAKEARALAAAHERRAVALK
jgi:hypothetical protein